MNLFSGNFGLPSSQQLREYRIWDSYFLPSYSNPGADGHSRTIADIERTMLAIEKGEIERLCYFSHVGIGTTTNAAFEKTVRSNPKSILKPLERWPELLLGVMQLNVNDVGVSLDALDRWIKDGPMLGVYFAGSGPGAAACSHPNMIPLVERIAELDGFIMQHTWDVTGGKTGPEISLPAELAALAGRFPDQKFICAHAGGEWEKGIRAVRDVPNILVETSGFDATAGFIEMAVRELGADRIIFGSHLPSRSLGTELGKIIGAEISERDRGLILGKNFRDLLAPLFKRKGIQMK